MLVGAATLDRWQRLQLLGARITHCATCCRSDRLPSDMTAHSSHDALHRAAERAAGRRGGAGAGRWAGTGDRLRHQQVPEDDFRDDAEQHRWHGELRLEVMGAQMWDHLVGAVRGQMGQQPT